MKRASSAAAGGRAVRRDGHRVRLRAGAALIASFVATGSTEATQAQRSANQPRAEAAPCLAGSLPRVTDRDWSHETIARFLGRSLAGPVAVHHAGGKTELLSDCGLEGRYLELRGMPDSGRFWASERNVYAPAQLRSGCERASHLATAFAVKRRDDTAKPLAFEALLIPLACPSVTAKDPAARCIGKGLTGAEREARAQALAEKIGKDAPAAQRLQAKLELLALAPDSGTAQKAVQALGSVKGDSHVGRELSWYLSPGSDTDPPEVDTTSELSPYRSCFPRLFRPQASVKRICSCDVPLPLPPVY